MCQFVFDIIFRISSDAPRTHLWKSFFGCLKIAGKQHLKCAMIEAESDSVSAGFRYANEHPAFTGIIEFEMAFEALGMKFKRQARLEFTCTPFWEHFDTHQQKVVDGFLSIGHKVLLLVESLPKEIRIVNGELSQDELTWQPAGALDEALPEELVNTLDDLIEAKCEIEDKRRRRLARQGKPVDAKPISIKSKQKRPRNRDIFS